MSTEQQVQPSGDELARMRRELIARLSTVVSEPVVQPLMLSMSTAALANSGADEKTGA